MRDPYEVLGVRCDATDDEVKKAYRRKVIEHHPDRNGGCKQAEGRFKEIQRAYEKVKADRAFPDLDLLSILSHVFEGRPNVRVTFAERRRRKEPEGKPPGPSK